MRTRRQGDRLNIWKLGCKDDWIHSAEDRKQWQRALRNLIYGFTECRTVPGLTLSSEMGRRVEGSSGETGTGGWCWVVDGAPPENGRPHDSSMRSWMPARDAASSLLHGRFPPTTSCSNWKNETIKWYVIGRSPIREID